MIFHLLIHMNFDDNLIHITHIHFKYPLFQSLSPLSFYTCYDTKFIVICIAWGIWLWSITFHPFKCVPNSYWRINNVIIFYLTIFIGLICQFFGSNTFWENSTKTIWQKTLLLRTSVYHHYHLQLLYKGGQQFYLFIFNGVWT